MWIQISCWYGIILIGVYSFVLPQGDALLQKMPYRNPKELRILAQEISNNKDNNNEEFKKLVKPMLIPRMPDTPNNLFVQNYIKDHFNNLNWNIEEDTFTDWTPYGTKTFTNIIATFEPNVKNKMVLACHFDSKNMTDRRGNELIAATDSAVPCAIMMDIANKLDCGMRRKQINRKRSLSKDITIQMMFFDGEEAYKQWTATDSLYGSRHLAKWLKDTPDPYFPESSRLNTIDIFVLLDLIGSGDVVFKNFFQSTTPHFKYLTKIEKALKDADLLNPKGVNFGSTRDKILFSKQIPWGHVEDDHKPFMHERPDISVLHLISSPFPSVWHTMSDNGNAINYDVTDNFIRIFRVFVATYIDIPAVSCKK